MNFSAVYLVERCVYRIVDFLRHWYVRSFRIYFNFVFLQLERLDRRFAWMVTFKNLFQPLYKDYTIIGYIIGFLFRSIRLFIASVVYCVIFVVAVGLFLVWLLTPPVLFLSAIHW